MRTSCFPLNAHQYNSHIKRYNSLTTQDIDIKFDSKYFKNIFKNN